MTQKIPRPRLATEPRDHDGGTSPEIQAGLARASSQVGPPTEPGRAERETAGGTSEARDVDKEREWARKWAEPVAPPKFVSLVAGEGFEPPTFGL